MAAEGSSSSGCSFAFEGTRKFSDALRERVAAMNEANKAFITEGAYMIEREAKKRVAEGGRHARGTPTPATPGSGPAVISGTLRRSIHTVITGRVGSMEAMIGPSAVYGRRVELEYNYPYMRPTVNWARPQIAMLARKWYRRALRV